LAVEPLTSEVWVSVNEDYVYVGNTGEVVRFRYERDELGDNLPPDYFTSIKDGGFYGWPYSYIVGHPVRCHRQAAGSMEWPTRT